MPFLPNHGGRDHHRCSSTKSRGCDGWMFVVPEAMRFYMSPACAGDGEGVPT